MNDLIKSARVFAIGHSRRISADRSPALQNVSSHLKSVAQIVASVSNDEETIAAAWLHDVVGDTGVTICDVERRFGTEIAKIVGELTMANPTERDSNLPSIASDDGGFSGGNIYRHRAPAKKFESPSLGSTSSVESEA